MKKQGFQVFFLRPPIFKILCIHSIKRGGALSPASRARLLGPARLDSALLPASCVNLSSGHLLPTWRARTRTRPLRIGARARERIYKMLNSFPRATVTNWHKPVAYGRGYLFAAVPEARHSKAGCRQGHVLSKGSGEEPSSTLPALVVAGYPWHSLVVVVSFQFLPPSSHRLLLVCLCVPSSYQDTDHWSYGPPFSSMTSS